MKKIYKKLFALGFIFSLTLFIVSCNNDDSFTYETPLQADLVNVSINVSPSLTAECQTDVALTSTGKSTVYYMILPSTIEAPLSADLWNFGTALDFDEAGTFNFMSDMFTPSVNFRVYAISVNTDGLRSEEVYTASYTAPALPLNIASAYTGTSIYQPAGANFTAQSGYTVTFTSVSGMDNTYDLDTVWGPDYVFTLTGGQFPAGDYPGPIRIQIDPSNFQVIVLSGGEPSGQGYAGDFAYIISGSGTYDACTESFLLNLNDESLFGEPVNVILE